MLLVPLLFWPELPRQALLVLHMSAYNGVTSCIGPKVAEGHEGHMCSK